MSQEKVLTEEGSHYEVSLTAGQAFVAFVLLLLSLAASFAFGLLIGKGDDRMSARRDAAIVNEAVTASSPRSAELGPVPARRRSSTSTGEGARPTSLIQEGSDPSPLENAAQPPALGGGSASPAKKTGVPAAIPAPADFQRSSAPQLERHAEAPAGTVKPAAVAEAKAKPAVDTVVPYYAQLMSTSDQKAAEVLAAKLIDNGFMGAYVERGSGPKGETFRVRVKFSSESSARAAIDGLKPFSKEIWVTKQP